MWLNPYGREAGRHKLKNGLKTQKMHFLPVFELTSASLTAIWVEPHQCPSHQSILLTQGPIHEILAEIAQLLAMLKNSVFLSQPFSIFFSKKKKNCFIPMKSFLGIKDGSKFWWFLCNCVCHSIRSMSRVLGIDNFGSNTRSWSNTYANHCAVYEGSQI